MKTIQSILTQHGVETKVIGSTLLAYEVWTLNGVLDGQWVDATKWSISDCKLFLGY